MMQAHEIGSGRALAAEDLEREGVLVRTLPLENEAYQAPLDELKQSQGYIAQDVIELRPDTPKLAELCAKFDAEHLHEEDEVRFLLDGAGIFDIRSREGQWMRVVVEPGDLIVVPAKRYHRFELTESKTMRCIRLFQDERGWVPHYR